MAMLFAALAAAPAPGQSEPASGSQPASDASASDALVSLPVFDRAGGGYMLPLSLQLTNPTSADATAVRIGTNQLFQFDIETLLPAGQQRQINFGLWYFDGPLELQPIQLLQGDKVIHRYTAAGRQPFASTVQALQPEARLILLDARLADAAADDQPSLGQLQPRQLVASHDSRRPLLLQLADLSAVQTATLAGSQVAAMVVPQGAENIGRLRSAAQYAMIPLWTLSPSGQLQQISPSPALPHRVLSSSVLRPDLVDRSLDPPPGRLPDQLFTIPSPSAALRLKLLLPALLAAPLLVVLAIIGRLLPHPWSLASIAVIVVGSSIWLLLLVQGPTLATVQTLTVTYGDGQSGHRLQRNFAMLTSVRTKSVGLAATQPTLPPRPQLISTDHRADYAGLSARRNLQGQWSLENVTILPGHLLLFAFDQPLPPAAPTAPDGQSAAPPSALPRLRVFASADGRPRLAVDESLQAVSLIIDGQLWDFADVQPGQTYSALAGPRRLALAAVQPDGEAQADPLRRRALQWVSRQWYRPEYVLVVGWQPGRASLETSGAVRRDLGRLVVWAIPRQAVQAE